jgi:DNA-directed RNA polymerase specialized sigma24 family protein
LVRLILPYEHSVYRLTHCYMRNREDAADVAQGAFIKAYRQTSYRLRKRKFIIREDELQP